MNVEFKKSISLKTPDSFFKSWLVWRNAEAGLPGISALAARIGKAAG